MADTLTPALAEVIVGWIFWLTANGGWAAAAPIAIEAMKRSRLFPWLDQYTDRINVSISLLFALLGSLGIGTAYDMAAGTLLVTGLTPINIARFVVEVAIRFGGQELVYRTFIKGPKP